VRLTPPIDKKLRELAEARGIDLNAAVSVAIAEDWTKTCR
jgi:post-segregation antitoxin (ccd killing protein)